MIEIDTAARVQSLPNLLGRVSVWPNLVGEDYRRAVATIRQQRRDVNVIRILPPGHNPEPLQRGEIRVLIHVNDDGIVVDPPPHIG